MIWAQSTSSKMLKQLSFVVPGSEFGPPETADKFRTDALCPARTESHIEADFTGY